MTGGQFDPIAVEMVVLTISRIWLEIFCFDFDSVINIRRCVHSPVIHNLLQSSIFCNFVRHANRRFACLHVLFRLMTIEWYIAFDSNIASIIVCHRGCAGPQNYGRVIRISACDAMCEI
jgi:hypothetical protein